MKKIIFTGIMGLLSIGVFAQNWTVDGTISIQNYHWDVAQATNNETELSLSVIAGRYVTDSLNIGLRGAFGLGMGSNTETGYRFTVGPRIKYDFLKYERVYFSILGGVYYARLNNYYVYGNYLQEDVQRIAASISPAITFQVNESIGVYWQFAEASYQHTWFDHSQSGLPVKTTVFDMGGPFTNPSFGLTFSF